MMMMMIMTIMMMMMMMMIIDDDDDDVDDDDDIAVFNQTICFIILNIVIFLYDLKNHWMNEYLAF